MKRPLLAASLAAVTVLALIAVPGSANAGGPKYARVAPRGGPVNMARLSTAPTRAPQANWTVIAPMAQGIQENGGGAYANGKLYVPGGFINFTGPLLYDKMQAYNTATGTWQVDPQPMPAPAAVGSTGWADAGVCAGPDGKIYVVNGVDGAFLYAALQIYDPAAPLGTRWSFGNAPNIGGNFFYSQDSGCSVIGGNLYVYGGYGVIDPAPDASVQKITWAMNLVTGTWSDTGKLMKNARMWHAYHTASGRGLAAGGINNLDTFTPLASVEVFTPATGWATVAPLPKGRLAPGMGVVTVGPNTYIAVFGGGVQNPDGSFTLQTSTVACSVPSPACTGWVDANRNLNTARWFHAWGSSSSAAYVAGGGNSAGATLSSAERAP